MTPFLSRPGVLGIQLWGLILATSVTAGGGLYPGNVPSLFVVVKFLLFLLPVIVLRLRMVRDANLQATVNMTAHQNMLLGLFLVAIMISLPLSVSPLFSLQRYGYTLLGFLSLFCIGAQYAHRRHAFADYARHVAAIGSWLFLSLFIVMILDRQWDLRAMVQHLGVIHPNMLSSLCAQLFVIILFAPLSHSLRWCVGLGLLVTIALLQSRGVYLSLLSGLGLTLLIRNAVTPTRRSLLALTSVVLVALGFSAACVFSSTFFGAVLQLFARGQTMDDLLSLTNRIPLWYDLQDVMTVKQFLVGHGYALMSPAIGVDFGTGLIYGAHNAYLSLYLGTGILASGIFMVYWITRLLSVWVQRAGIDRHHVDLYLASSLIFLTHACVAEEFGLHLTPTCALLFLNFQTIRRRS